VLVNWLYLGTIMMVHSSNPASEKILPPQVVLSLLKGPKEVGHNPQKVEVCSMWCIGL